MRLLGIELDNRDTSLQIKIHAVDARNRLKRRSQRG
jgi:hypothetical protein